MKKSIVLAMAVAFLAATSGLVLAQDATGSAPPKTTHKSHKSKKTHKHKKVAAASSTTAAPAASTDSTAPAAK